jgi:ParB family chromosome partitioning protein
MTGQNRKSQLKALFGTIDQGEGNAGRAEPNAAPTAPDVPSLETKAFGLAKIVPAETLMRPRTSSGAVKAMGLSLGGLSREVEEARRLKESLDTVERVVEIDPGLIDASFVSDRLGRDGADEGLDELVRSIEANGQQVPVLLRPHPDQAGRYQTAYGHRRIQAATRLGRPVKAIVRSLSDTELVLAQGKENTERRDLSFIERAFFAHALIARGFERGVVQDALSLHKAEMTRFLQVAEAVPLRIANAIGPAPKIGRPRWMALAELLKGEAARVKAQDEITSAGFRATTGSDARFNRVFERLSRRTKPPAPGPLEVRGAAGRTIARIDTARGRARVDFVDKFEAGFAEYLQAELPKLLESFALSRKPKG